MSILVEPDNLDLNSILLPTSNSVPKLLIPYDFLLTFIFKIT